MLLVIIFVCSSIFVGCSDGQKTLKACPSYLAKTNGHMIDYSILDDYEYDFWQTKYGVYKGYKGKQQNTIHDYEQSNSFNSFAEPFQQRQGQFRPKGYREDTTTEPGTTETTTEAPEPEVLEVWKLKLPLAARKAYVIPIADENEPGEVTVPFEITTEDLKDRNKTTRGQDEMIQTADITLNELKVNRWYVICIELAINSGDKGGPCLHCQIERVCDNYDCDNNELFVVDAPLPFQTTSSAKLIFTFREFPVTVTSITIDVIRDPKDSRCEESIPSDPVSQKVLWPVPDSIAEISIDKLQPLDRYNVFIHLLFQLPSNSFNLPNSFLIKNYAKETITKCDYAYEYGLE